MSRNRVHIQRDFSGGIVSSKMLMRDDTEAYAKSALGMQNFMPTPQGTALRVPGTRYYEELTDDNTRLIPFLSLANERCVIKLTPTTAEIIFNAADRVREDFVNVVDDGAGSFIFRKRVNRNPMFGKGLSFWKANPAQFTARDGFPGLGVYIKPGTEFVTMHPRIYNDPGDGVSPVTLESDPIIVDTPTSVGTLRYHAGYGSNWAWRDEFGGFEFIVEVSDDPTFATTLYSRTWSDVEFPEFGSQFHELTNFDMPTPDWTGTLYVRVTAAARPTTETPYSAPVLDLYNLFVFANGEVPITSLPAPLTTPYTAEDLPDVQFVQSPYSPKEIVFTHPRHPPQRLFFDTGLPGYVWEAITFTNTPPAWAENNYPAACTSYNGRLVLAGGAEFKTGGGPLAAVSETVWLTEVGNWTTFTATPTNPDDSIEFTSIYRSPLQWVYGQKSLLIGAREFELAAQASSRLGVLTPNDIGVFIQSTHGSRNVQPAGMGEGVMFAADAGKKMRLLGYRDESQGWVASDMTLFYPEACKQGIVRMVRQRTPQQMVLVLLEDGTLSIFHSESGVAGWTKYVLNNAEIKDICVMPDDNGTDVVYMVVNRVVNGDRVTYLECIPNWTEEFEWDYSECTKFYQFETPTDTITGLEHLEGQIVHVYDEIRYIGTYTVDDGEIVLSDGTDTGTTEVINARVGLMHRAILRTLPPAKVDPGAPMRFSDFAVRVVNSTLPIINGQRPANRRPGMQLGFSQTFERFEDVDVTTEGYDAYQSIEISEQAPFRCEIVGVYGTLHEGDVS